MLFIFLLGLGRAQDDLVQESCDSYVACQNDICTNDPACQAYNCTTYFACQDYDCTSMICVEASITEPDAKPLWLILCGAQVFFMQLGFTNLEAGAVSRRNVLNIIFKNIMDCLLGTMIWFLFGWGVAWGEGSFIGGSSLSVVRYEDNTDWFFQWAFCVTASTIVSGAVAERMKLKAYFLYTIMITGFIYPVVVHWVWSAEGWASAFNENADAPAIDFAGSGVVHMVGGWSGLMGAYVVGPRAGRFEKAESALVFTTHSEPLQAFGTLVLWFGWYGFNCGSTVAVLGVMETAALAAVTTTLAAAAGGLATGFTAVIFTRKWSIGLTCNGILAGLVSITASCSVVPPTFAIIIGFLGGLFYFGFSRLMIRLKIDDPLDAVAVHGCCGFWGFISVAIFGTKEYMTKAAYNREAGQNFGTRLGNQLTVALAITAWTISLSGLLFFLADKAFKIRTDMGSKIGGLDKPDFGKSAYETSYRKIDLQKKDSKAEDSKVQASVEIECSREM